MRKDSDAQKKALYSEYLKRQIEEDYMRKKEAVKMTDRERKLNIRDLQAYENRDSSVHSKLVGMSVNPRKFGLSLSPVKNGPLNSNRESLLGKAGAYAMSPLSERGMQRQIESGLRSGR